MKESGMKYKYIEVTGGDHGTIIDGSKPEILAFFKEQVKLLSK